MRLLFFVIISAVSAASAQTAPVKDLSFGGQVRSQYEETDVESYAAAATRRGKDLLSLRTRLWMQAKPGPGLTAYVQLQDSRVAGQETSVAGNDNLTDLHQGYLTVADLFGKPVDLTVGRMELRYGDQRLVSPLDWSVIGRAWDGLLLRARLPSSTVDAFATNVKEAASARRDQNFWGVYGTCKAVKDHELEAYLLGRDFGNEGQVSEVRADKGNLSDRTVGTRVKGKAGAADYSGEAAWQFGRKAGMPVRAWAAALTGGWTFDGEYKPRLGTEYTYASGDTDPADDKVQTFDPLFTFGHAFQGYQDVFAWRNGHAVKLSASAVPVTGTTVALDYHYFRTAQARDAWYGAAGTALARDNAGLSGNEVGHEVDVHVRTPVRGALKLWFGVSHFFASSFVRAKAGGKDRHWAFVQATLDF